jgi:hypothetical protein
MYGDYKKANPPKDSWNIAPLPDLGAGLYKGQQGGLYPGGLNAPPEAHLLAGLRIAKSIVPLNADGQPDPSGKIVLTAELAGIEQIEVDLRASSI